MELSKNICKIRKMNNLSAIELAKKVGITQGYLSEIENDKKIPTVDVLQRIARELNVTVSDLLGETSMTLSEELLQLLDKSKDLSSEQINALITVAKAFSSSPKASEKVDKDKNENKEEEYKPEIIARAAHYEGHTGLTDDEQSIIDMEIEKIKRQYNPDGTPKNGK